MPVHVTFRMPTGEHISAGHGALLGRLTTAAIHLDDGRVSEAHAMVSLRGRDVRLLALRGRFTVEGKVLADVVLRAGLRVAVTPDHVLEVVSVTLPDTVMAVSTDAGSRVLLGVTSFLDDGEIRIEHGWRPGAAVVLWPKGDRWSSTRGPVEVGDVLQIGAHQAHLVAAPVVGTAATVPSLGLAVPLSIVTRFDTVHLHREGQPPVLLSGISARIMTELAVAGAPLAWEDLARSVWTDADRVSLRRRWDMQLLRLRRRLRNAGIREGLVHSAGTGLVELVIGPADRVVDES